MRFLSVLLASIAVLTSCRKEEVSPPAPSVKTPAPGPARVEGVSFELATPTVIDEPTPARFSADPPSTVEALEGALDAELLSGRVEAEPALRQAIVTALERSVQDGGVPDALSNYYVSAFGFSPGPQTCDWLGEQLRTTNAPVHPVLVRGLARCRRAADAPLFEREAPDAQYVSWCFDLDSDVRIPFSKRFGQVARRRMKSATSTFELRGLGFCFAHMNGPEVRKEVAAILREKFPPERQRMMKLGLLRSPDPALVALGRSACVEELANDAMCSGRTDPALAELFAAPNEPGRGASLSEVIEYYGPESDEVRKLFGDAVAAKTIETCARRGDDAAGRCLLKLASTDRSAAVRFLELHGARLALKQNEVGLITRTLRAYPDGGVQARLVTDGLLPADAGVLESQVTVERILEAANRISRFDVETGTFPNRHDVLLAGLASLTPALADVVFAEVAPSESEMESGPYELRAWSRGKRYSVTASNNGDWYDVPTTVGLLNALLIARQSPERFVILPTGDQTTSVLVAPLPVLETLQRDGLIELTSGDSAMNAGKDFEDRVFQQLRGLEK